MTLRAALALAILAGAMSGALLPPLTGCGEICPDQPHYPPWDLPVGIYTIIRATESGPSPFAASLEVREDSMVELSEDEVTIRIGVEGEGSIEATYQLTEQEE